MDSIIEQVIKNFPAGCWKKASAGCYIVRKAWLPEGIECISIEASSGDPMEGMGGIDPEMVFAPPVVYLTVHVDKSHHAPKGYAAAERAIRAPDKCVDKIGLDPLIGLYDELVSIEKKRELEVATSRRSLVIKLLEKGPPKSDPCCSDDGAPA